MIGPINLDVKRTGKRSAGNPHATFEAAGTGNGATARLVRHSQRKRGAPDRPDLTDRTRPRPYPTLRPAFLPGATQIVTPAPLTITADDQTSMAGSEALPTLTASYSGFVYGDTTASLTTLPTLSTTATVGSDAGDYPITVSGAVDANYAITYVGGTLSILSTAPTATTLAWSTTNTAYGKAVTLTATVNVPMLDNGPATGGTVTFMDGNNTLGTASVSITGPPH